MDYETKCITPFNSLNGMDTINPIYLDFAGSDSILTNNDYMQYPDLQMYPSVVGAVVPIFNIPNFPKTDNLILTPKILARIFRKCISEQERLNGNCGPNKNDIIMWNDTDIIKVNEDNGTSEAGINALKAAGEIKIVVRDDGSGTTEIFRDALSAFDDDFKNQVGTGSNSIWNFVDVIKAPGNEGVSSYVLQNPGSIGYSVLGEAMQLKLSYAALTTESGLFIVASPEAVTYTALELGMQFGNNGDIPSRLTAKLINSKGFKTWPICGYSYFLLRKNTLRPGATCETRRATLDFMTWIYTSTVAASLAASHGFSTLPSTVAEYVLNEMRTQLLCPDKNEKVYIEPLDSRFKVNLYGANELGQSAIDLFASTYSKTISQKVSIIYNDASTASNNLMSTETTSFVPYSLLKGSNLKGDENLVLLPYGGIAFTVITNFCGLSLKQCLHPEVKTVQMSLNMLAKILMKDITKWSETGNLNLPNEQIKIFLGPTQNSLLPEFSKIMSKYYTNWNFETVINNIDARYETNDVAVAAVRNQPYSIAIVPYIGNGIDFETIIKVNILDASNTVYIQASLSSITKCFEFNNYIPSLASFDLEKSKAVGCYPLIVPISVKSKKSYNKDLQAAQETSKFLNWLFSNELSSPLNEQNIAPLWTMDITSPTGRSLKEFITETLYSITNDGISMLKPRVEDKNLIDDSAVIAGLVLCTICVGVCIFFSLWLLKYQKTRVVRLSSPPFMQQILFGASLSILTIIPLGIQDGGILASSGMPLDAACASIPFLFSMGTCITHGALMLKTWRISRIFNNPKLKTVNLPDKKLLYYEGIFLSIVLIVNIIWCATYPLHWVRKVIDYNDDGSARSSIGSCQSEYSTLFLILLAILIASSLFYGNYLAYKTRNVPDEFAEGKWIAISLMVMLEALLLGIPVIVISSTDPTASFIVTFSCILIMAMGTVCFLFCPKISLVLYNEAAKRTLNDSDENKKKKQTPNTGVRDSSRSTRPVPHQVEGLVSNESNAKGVSIIKASSMNQNAIHDEYGHDAVSFGVQESAIPEPQHNKSKSTLTIV